MSTGALLRLPTAEDVRAFREDGVVCLRGVLNPAFVLAMEPAVDHADAESGAMRFVRGSHRWRDQFRPNWFVSSLPMPGTEGELIPDIEALAAAGEVEVLQFDLGPGDMTVHHARTLHAAGANLSRTRRRRAISLRYCGDDVRYHFRPGAPRKAHHAGVHEGDSLDGPDCPVVWQSGAG